MIAFLSSSAQKTLKMESSPVLLATLLASFGWLVFTLYGAPLGQDRQGQDLPDRLPARYSPG